MDGLKRPLKDSLQFQISFWLSLVILAVAIVAGIFSFIAAFREAHELQDDVLRQVASLFDQHHLPLSHSDDSGRQPRSDEESRVIVQYLEAGAASGNAKTAPAPLALPTTLPDGIQTLTVGGEQYRLWVKTMTSGARIAIAQEVSFRDEIARDSALRTVMPFLLLVPILLLVLADLIRRMFRPIAVLSAGINQRSEQDLQSFATETLPAEVRPFVVAINRLLGRIARSVDAQKRFIADAAHELRSPLAALSLQAERLANAEMSECARDRLLTLSKGIDRGSALLDQLLALARAQLSATTSVKEVSVQQVFRSVLESLMPLANAKGIDIGVEGKLNPTVLVDEAELITVIKNLVDNAIRYTPRGGRIDLAAQVTEHQVILQVSDSGPGIPTEERHRVFDAFYRIPGSDETGSGLGLSIVKAITDRIGADIEMDYADNENKAGLCVKVAVPRHA